MITYDLSIFIDRPPQEVWPYIAEPINFSQWQGSAKFAEWTSEGPPGVGSTFRGVAKFLGRKIESTSEITIWAPPSQYGLKSTSGPIPFESTTELESKQNGTQLNLHAQMEVGGFFKMAQGLVAKKAKKQNNTDLEALKLLLEVGQA